MQMFTARKAFVQTTDTRNFLCQFLLLILSKPHILCPTGKYLTLESWRKDLAVLGPYSMGQTFFPYGPPFQLISTYYFGCFNEKTAIVLYGEYGISNISQFDCYSLLTKKSVL